MIITRFIDNVDKEYEGIKYHHMVHDYPYIHGHDYFEFFICTNGSYIQTINGTNYTFNKYDCSLLTPNDTHNVKDNSLETGHYTIAIKSSVFKCFCDALSPNLYQKIYDKSFQLFSISEAELRKIISLLNQLRDTDDEEERKLVSTLLIFNLIEPIINTTKLVYTNTKSEWLNDLLIEINKPANLNWSVSDVIKNSNYSHTHLSRMFKEEMNESLVKYLTDVKMANARDLLINSNISLEEVCNILGYSSLSHFNNIFKKYYTLSPGKYRAKNKRKSN